MAIIKEIKQEDGVTTSYHRILALTQTINSHNSIEVLSYVDAKSRETENAEVRPYKQGITFELEYDENMTIADAYNYLKTLELFEGAKNA